MILKQSNLIMKFCIDGGESMAISFRTRPDLNLAIIEHIGSIPDDEIFAFYKGLYENATLDPSMNQLVDLRKADSTPRSPEILRHCAEFVRDTLTEITPYPKIAVIAPKDLTFGLARMYEALIASAPCEFVVFRSLDAALAWLGLPEDLLDRDY